MRPLASYGRDGADAYDLVDRLPPGPARAAAWNAYACQVFADKLSDACRHPSDETARVVRALYDLARDWLERAHGEPAAVGLALPHWGTPVRTRDQLVGMRETLTALRTAVAYGLQPELAPRLDALDRRIDAVDAIWIERPTPELRGGIGDQLANGIREATELGRTVALGTA